MSVNAQQHTLKHCIRATGVGLHTGKQINLLLRPGKPDSGIVFKRSDLYYKFSVKAHAMNVGNTTMATSLTDGRNELSTIEHLMAAFAGLGIDNAEVEVDAAELPIMDGSAQPFVDLMQTVGIVELDAVRRSLRVKKAVRVSQGDSYCELLPEDGCVFEAEIDFQSGAIGRQAYQLDLMTENFDVDVAGARTFCMLHQVEAMHSAGLALGGSIENAILVDGDVVMNEEGLRSPKEFVQHKLLDAIGDLYLLGLPLIGRYRGHKSGHALHNKLLHALFLEADAFELVNLSGADKILAAE